MKKTLIAAVVVGILGIGFAMGQIESKLWITSTIENRDRIYFIQDKETGTRCYGITNAEVNVSGYAISCVK